MDSRKKIECIFFDFDGVLAESVNVKTEAFRKMYEKYGNDFAQKVVDHHKANGGVSRYEKFKIYNGEWLGETITNELIDTLADEFSNLVVDGVVNSKEVSGATQFLDNSAQYKKYIITGTPTKEIIPILERRKMSHYFDGIYGSPNKKDYWVKKILKEENINPNQCVFIGDALADYQAAELNNVEFILRETEDGKLVFSDYKGYKLKDLKTLQEKILKINESC